MLIPRLNYFHLIIVPGDGDLVDIHIGLVEPALDPKNGLLGESIEKGGNFFVNLFHALNSESKDISSRELRRLYDQSYTIFGLPYSYTLDLHPRDRNIESLSQLCEPNDSDICDDVLT